MAGFLKKWSARETPRFGKRVKEAVRPSGPLRPRIELASRYIQMQISKLDSMAIRLKERDSTLFNKVVSNIQKHDMQHASIYANELAEVRKMYKMVNQAKVALEQIVLRLNTATELGDIVVTLAPAMTVIRTVKAGLVQVMPEAEREISEISSLLSSILVDAGQLGGLTLNFEAANEDAERILMEASAIAEQKMKDKFPELPGLTRSIKQ